MQLTQDIQIKDHRLDFLNLPEAAQEELIQFYDFLVYKYQQQIRKEPTNKQQILSAIFEEAKGTLPRPYVFDRDSIHER